MLQTLQPAPFVPATEVTTLPNGLRVVALPMPWRHAVSCSVFVRTGSLHEPRSLNGISHVVEHMAFKGTQLRDCQRINLDAERLGAEVNAHTDKDHTAFHIDGLARDLGAFVELLADIVLHGSFPPDELERERRVILQEFSEVEDDPETLAFQLFDSACWGEHPAGQPVIGRRATIERITRADLLDYVARQYTAANVVVAAAGPIDGQVLLRHVEQAFAGMPAGSPNQVPVPAWQGGLKLRRMSGSPQCHLVLGTWAPPLADSAHLAHVLAAALLGEGMSSPLLDELRERRGLAYHAGCWADIQPLTGQFVIEAATAPAQAAELLQQVARLLREQAEHTDGVALERARNQIAVRAQRDLDNPARRLEAAAQDLFCTGQLRNLTQLQEHLHAIDTSALRAVFAQMLNGRAAVALAGSVPARVREQAGQLFCP
jgi:predicted Zn-dependent peptidase